MEIQELIVLKLSARNVNLAKPSDQANHDMKWIPPVSAETAEI